MGYVASDCETYGVCFGEGFDITWNRLLMIVLDNGHLFM